MKAKRALAVLLVVVLMMPLATSVLTVYADDSVVLGVNVANKLEIALAVGPTNVDYSMFEADLRARLALKSPAVAEEDLIVTAAKAVSAATTDEFSWWVYDHTKPATMLAANGTPYGGVKNVSDATHTYIENDLGNTTTGSSQGTVTNTNTASQAYTPDTNNKDIGSSRHPYQGNEAHMTESNNGATMDFYGYAHDSYKDFRYLPNDQKTKKVFEFAIQEDIAHDALDGVGFFFNTDITGSYESKNQLMSGYLLFLEYNSSGKGAAMKIYKFKDVNTYTFHQSMANTTASTTTSYLVSNYKEGSTTKFELVSSSTIYNGTDKYRRIKLEVYPTYIKAYYNGSASNATVLTTPIAEGATAVNFTGGSLTGTQISLDQGYVKDYGFGPMASYRSHTCARPTHLTLQNLSMVVDQVRSLTGVVREPDWHATTQKFLVNLNEEPIEDFSSTSITGELLNRLRNDDIYYIGWCSDQNASESQSFLTKNDLKGLVVNIEDPAMVAYDTQIQAIADEVYKRYWRENDDNVVLSTDNVILSVSGGAKTGSSDPEWPNGKWKTVHKIDTIDNDEGVYALSNQYVSDLDLQFNKPGEYDIYYRDQYLKTITAHRPPVASFDAVLNADVPTFVDESYDPDDQANGIVSSVWSYLDLDNPGQPAPVTGLTSAQLHAALPTLIKDHTYIITVTVTDKYGAVSTLSKQVRYVEGTTPDEFAQPFADFEVAPQTILKGVGSQKIFVTDKSYDLQGLNVIPTFTVTKNGNPVGFTIAEGENNISSLAAGDYVISLIVNNGHEDSVPVTRQFSIVEDTIVPTASASLATGNFSVNTSTTITFSDFGGSEFKEQRIAMTNNNVAPASDDSSWTLKSASNSRVATINKVGTTFIHWEATDYAGNVGRGTFGPYTLSKQDPELTLSASPANTAAYPTPITLTATFAPAATPSGSVYFYLGENVIGSATIAGGIAEITYAHTLSPLPLGELNFSASYLGDMNYNADSGALSYTITKNATATVTVGAQTNKAYDGEIFEPVDINVTGTNQYETRYTGREGTSYDSTTPPTNAGKYTVTVTTTDPGYVEVSDSADFEILKREITVSLVADPSGSAMAKSDVTLTATVSGAIDMPTGTIKFSQDGEQIGSNAAITFDSAYEAETTWENVSIGTYDLKAEYIAAANDNYVVTTEETISGYSVVPNNGATVTIAPQTNRAYDSTAFSVTGITVTGATTHKVEYVGRDGTEYSLSEIPPVNAGKYTVIVTTTDSNYIEKSANADFEITKRQLTLNLTVNPSSDALATQDIALSVNILNALELPLGSIKFSIDDETIDSNVAISLLSGSTYTAATSEWENVLEGTYDIKAEYVPADNDNYTALAAESTGYDVSKQNQTDFMFSEDNGLTELLELYKVYGDSLDVIAIGGQSSADVVYTVTSGDDVILVDSETGEGSILKIGTAVITATKPADDAYNQITATITVYVEKAPGDFGSPEVKVIYTPGLTLADVISQLSEGYAWDDDTIELKFGNDQYFAATYTDPSGNYETVSGLVLVNVARKGGGGGSGGSTSYTVSFDSNEGSAVAKQSVVYAGKATEPEKPVKEGYSFDGWYTDKKLTSLYDFDARVIENITLYAKWTEGETGDDGKGSEDGDNGDDGDGGEEPGATDGEYEYTEKPFVTGYPNGIFKPEGEITRAEIAQILYNLLADGEKGNMEYLSDFEDIDSEHWVANAMAWAIEYEYFKGYNNGLVKPNANITRAELAAVLHRVARDEMLIEEEAYLGEDVLSFFSDIHGHWAYYDIMQLAEQEVLQGYKDGSFAPQKNITRAETVTMISRLFERSDEYRVDRMFIDVPMEHWAYVDIMNAGNGI